MHGPEALTFPYEEPPAFGDLQEVADGVYWLQMPLPMSLAAINLYLLDAGDSWTVIDTGIRGEETRELWASIFDNRLGDKPVGAVICTHMHPDHTGQAGYICERFEAPLMMSFGEYYQARSMGTMFNDQSNWRMLKHFERAGFEPGFMQQMRESRSDFTPEPEDKPLPGSFTRLSDGDTVSIGRYEWQVITGTGHSPEHVCLYCKELRLLLSGDQILPIITSNVSVHPTEPEGNPMVGWLASHEKLKALLPHDLLVLPAHNLPFYGVHERLDQLIDHHEDRMLIIEENCVEPKTAVELLPMLFARALEGHSKFMAMGEALAHLHCLMTRGRIRRELDGEVYRYRSIDPTLPDRARPDSHEPPDDGPNMV